MSGKPKSGSYNFIAAYILMWIVWLGCCLITAEWVSINVVAGVFFVGTVLVVPFPASYLDGAMGKREQKEGE